MEMLPQPLRQFFHEIIPFERVAVTNRYRTIQHRLTIHYNAKRQVFS